jgi:hypothetical protein
MADAFSLHQSRFSESTLDGPALVCGLWANGRIAFVNDAWEATATREMVRPERWGIGAAYFEPMGLLEGFYRRAFRACLDKGERWEHQYLCSTPDRGRRFHLTVYPLDGALLTVHTLAFERPFAADELASPHRSHRDVPTLSAGEGGARAVGPRCFMGTKPTSTHDAGALPPCYDFYR